MPRRITHPPLPTYLPLRGSGGVASRVVNKLLSVWVCGVWVSIFKVEGIVNIHETLG
jgi:hypothetical protein